MRYLIQSVRFLWNNKIAALGYFALPLLSWLGVMSFEQQPLQAFQILSVLILSILIPFVLLIFLVKKALGVPSEDYKIGRFVRDAFNWVLAMLLLMLAVFSAVAPLAMISFALLHFSDSLPLFFVNKVLPVLAFLLTAGLISAFVYVNLKFMFLFPMIIQTGKVQIKKAFQATKGHVGTIAVIFFISAFVLIVFNLLIAGNLYMELPGLSLKVDKFPLSPIQRLFMMAVQGVVYLVAIIAFALLYKDSLKDTKKHEE